MTATAIVLAAGSGSRMGTAVKKQYLDLGGHPVLFYSLRAFEESPVDSIVLVTGKDDLESVRAEYMNERFPKIKAVVPGGRERYNSVYEGLRAAGPCDYILIHDGARPFVDGDMINRCLAALAKDNACVAAMPSKDTVKITDDNGYVTETPDRSRVWNVQTPQCFSYRLIADAYQALIDKENGNGLDGLHVTDDAYVVETFSGEKVKLIEGSYDNIKITTPSDIPLAESILAGRKRVTG